MINTYQNLFKDVWSTLKTKMGILAMIICFLTVGTGAASNLWSAVAQDWGASADTVALITGVFSGLLTTIGCLLGGWICDRMNRSSAYLIFGLFGALCAVAMAYSPKTELMYIIWTSVYSITLGFCYAGFTAIVLEAIGKGAAVTKYNIYVALSNSPIYLMIYIEGWAHSRWGAVGMLNIEAIFAVLAIIVFLIVQAAVKERKSLSLEILTVTKPKFHV
jgi:MFS transporter, PAT family, beta-lactamase induction signal transducer AmpG